jgi:organic radical activating enzyme
VDSTDYRYTEDDQQEQISADQNLGIPVAGQTHRLVQEGPFEGEPAIVLYVAGCNLMCGNPNGWSHRDQDDLEPRLSEDADWVCDTMAQWRDPEESHGPQSLVAEWADRGWIQKLQDGTIRHVVLTGGEPLMDGLQEAWGDLFSDIDRETDAPLPRVEVHTNGTFHPDRKLRSYVNHYVVSPKLSNSGMPEDERLNYEALQDFADINRSRADDWDAEFEFLLSSESDVVEVNEIVDKAGIERESVVVMPAVGEYVEDGIEDGVKEYALERGYRYRERSRGNI